MVLEMKQTFYLIFIIMMVVAIAGCTSQDTALNDSNTGKYSMENSTSTNSMENSTTTNTPEISNSTSDSRYEVSGLCYKVVDGDTIDVEGVGRIRLVGVNTPERGEPGYQTATDYVKSMVLGKKVYLDIDDAKNHDKYGRTLAVVYIDDKNLNQELLRGGYAEVMYIPPSEFNPYSWT